MMTMLNKKGGKTMKASVIREKKKVQVNLIGKLREVEHLLNRARAVYCLCYTDEERDYILARIKYLHSEQQTLKNQLLSSTNHL